MNGKMQRRSFLKYVGAGFVGALAGDAIARAAGGNGNGKANGKPKVICVVR